MMQFARVALLLLLATSALAVRPAAAAYRFEPLGTFGELRTEPSDIDDLGRVAGLLSGA